MITIIMYILITNHLYKQQQKKEDKLVYRSTVGTLLAFEHVIVMDVLYLNSLINHCIRNMSGYVLF